MQQHLANVHLLVYWHSIVCFLNRTEKVRIQVGVAIATVQLECETTDAKKEKRNTKQELDLNGGKSSGSCIMLVVPWNMWL